MSFHFAAARTAARSPVARALARRTHSIAANDNVTGKPRQAYETFGLDRQDLLLKAALRHFAEHGIRAAHEARKQAEKAFFADDCQSYEWWLGICRSLDRKIAAGIAKPNGPSLTL